MTGRDIKAFVPWLPNATGPELVIIRAVTGYDEMPVDGSPVPANAAEFAKVVDLVEKHDLHNLLCLLATDRFWWRVVANWGRLVDSLDTAQPDWRDGARLHPEETDAMLAALVRRPALPRRILLDMDGPLAAFDRFCFELCAAAGLRLNIKSLDEQTERFITHHLPDLEQQRALRTMVDGEGFYRAIPVVEGAQEGVEALLSAGHQIVICSKPHDPSPSCEPEKKAWLAEHFPMLASEYVFTNNKSYAYGGRNAILLDDAIKAEQVAEATWEPVTFGVPFNRPGSEYGRYPRWSWGDPIERLSW